MSFAFIFCALYIGVSPSVGQIRKQKKAQSEFDKYAYSDAIKTYEKIVSKNKANQRVYQLLGDSYYNSGNLEKAHHSYKALFELQDNGVLDSEIASAYYFKYAQTLKAVQDEITSEKMLQKWAALEPNDSRAQQIRAHDKAVIAPLQTVQSFELAPFNSEQADYGAVAYNNGYVFTSGRENSVLGKDIHTWTNQSYTSVFQVSKDQYGQYTLVEPLQTSLIDTAINQASAIFSQDGQTMFITANNINGNGRIKFNRKQNTLLKIFRLKKLADGSWSDLSELSINSDNFSCAHPALSQDQQWLYFSSDRDNGYGQSDLYRVKLENLDVVSEPENLGDKINTPGRESFAFIDQDNTLFFSSDRALGYGGLDVYKVAIDEQGNFGELQNIGTPFNSNFDDYAYSYSKKTNQGTISSNRKESNDNIYLFNLCDIQLSGLVKELQSALALQQVKISITSSLGTQELFSDDQGNFSTSLDNCEDKVVLVAAKEGYLTKELTLDNLLQNQQQKVVIELTKEQIQYHVDPIYFDFDKIIITNSAQNTLKQTLEILQQNPQMLLHISSYTDSRGSSFYNQGLSDRRAQQTLNWFLDNGVDRKRITAKGFGETNLVNDCADNQPCSVEKHRLNRRSEFVIE